MVIINNIEHYTLQEVCEKLKATKEQIRNYRRTNQIKATKYKNKYFFEIRSINKFKKRKRGKIAITKTEINTHSW